MNLPIDLDIKVIEEAVKRNTILPKKESNFIRRVLELNHPALKVQGF